MSDQKEKRDGSTGSPFLDGLSAFEAGIHASEALPDAMFAEPSFGWDHAQFGLLVGRTKVINFSLGPEGLQSRIGQFTGNRRRNISSAGVAKALGDPESETERLLGHIEQGLRAGIDAYCQTYRALVIEAYGTENPVAAPPEQSLSQELIEVAVFSERQRALRNRLGEEIGARPARPRRAGVRRHIAPFPDARPDQDGPGRSSGLSL